MAEKRQINEREKQQVLEKHGRVCFVDGAPIDDDESLEFHHIRPYSKSKETTIDNIAPVCKAHHRRIRTMSLQEFRDYLELDKFFSGDNLRYLDDVIKEKHGRCGEKIPSQTELCKSYSVSLITVKKAISELINQKYVYSRVGKGVYVADIQKTKRLDLEKNKIYERSAR